MELVKRTRHKRNGFVGAQLEHDTANPIGGNYYPVTSSLSIEDLSGNHVIIVTDRGQGKVFALALLNADVLTSHAAVQTCCGAICRGFLNGEWSA